MDVTAFRRVLVAGFISGGTDDVDANLETVRLLRSQLRSKSTLRVIEAEVLPLAELAADKAKPAVTDAAPVPQGAADAAAARGAGHSGCRRPPPKRGSAPRRTSRSSTIDLRRRRLLEEARRGVPEPADRHRHGAVHAAPDRRLRHAQPRDHRHARPPQRRPGPHLHGAQGLHPEPKFVFIDGRTGATLYSETFHEEILYNVAAEHAGAVVLLRADGPLIPSFLGTLSTQKIRGTRVLLK